MSLTHLLLLSLPFSQTPTTTGSWPALAGADWKAFTYQFLPDAASGDYVLAGQVAAESSQPVGRLALNVVDESNYYAVEFARDTVRVLRVESGLELPIGRSGRAGLTGRGAHALLLRREGARLQVFLDGDEVALAADEAFPAGKTATGSLRGSVAFRDLREQDDAPPFLEDDFMRAETDASGWETSGGAWRVQSLGSPVRSTNAFNFTSGPAPKGATAVTGDWFWHDYEVAASCQPHGPGPIGLYGYYADAGNCLLFLLGPTGRGGTSEAQLARARGGKRQVLATAPAPLQPGQWYRLAMRLEGDAVAGLIDGHEVVRAESHGLPGGRAGLYARGAEGATFDDFLVRPASALTRSLDFGEWLPLTGDWRLAEASSETETPNLKGACSALGAILLNQRITGDIAASARVLPTGKAEVGLIADWEDDRNYHLLTYGGDPVKLRLTQVADGQATTEAEAPVTAPQETVDLELSHRGGVLAAKATGSPGLLAWCPSFAAGRVGLAVRGGEGSFRAVDVRPLPTLPEVAHFEGAFTQEVSMADWAAENSDWATVPVAAGDPGPSYWHRSPCYSDCELVVRLKQPPAGPISLMAGATERGAADAYRFTVTPGPEGSCVLLRGSVPAATEKAPDLTAEGLQRIGLRRLGPMVVGLVNDQPRVVFRDPEPLRGLCSGFAAPVGAADPAEAVFRAENVLSYSFREAPSDWWVGSGDWRITNRWDCEPRWTFFIGGGKGVVSLWNKHEFGSDVTLDFYGAIRFDATRGYEYPQAANINCTIAADGRDLSTGYSLVFGGWDDKYTRLLRGNEVVAESTQAVIPRASSIHRRWFDLTMQKSAGRVRCWLDGAPLFDYTDPKPLSGRRVALWTYNNAIAVARVRIASSEARPGPLEAPDRVPLCCYDGK